MNNKIESLKEKLKQALSSTARVISDDFSRKTKSDNHKKTDKFEFFELDNLNTKGDFIKARAEYDSRALKRKFSDELIFKKNLPSNSSCKSLYTIAEKIRYEKLGCKMLKGIEKNLRDNYTQTNNLKRKDQLKSKEDVAVNEAFELYMLKNFHNIELNYFTSEMLKFWEKDFDKSIFDHIEFLKNNLENQNIYSSKFSQILSEMDIFKSEENEKKHEENQDDSQENASNDNDESETEDKKDNDNQNEADTSLDSDYNIDEYKLDEQLVDTDKKNQNSEQVIQKKILENLNMDYKVYTTEFDEITKAENLENSDEANKLRKALDQQLIGFQDIVTKLANKLQRQLLAKQNRAWDFDLEDGW